MENPKPPEDTTNMTEDDNPVQQQQQNSSDLKYLESVSKDAEALYNSAIFELHFLKAEGDYLQLDNFQARPSDKAINILDKLPVTEDSDDKIVELLASDEKKVQNEEANTRQKSLESSTGEKPIGRLTRAQSKEESEKQNATPPPQHKTVSRGQAARDAMSLKRADASQRLRNGSASVSSVEKVLMTKNFTESQRNAYVERVVNQLKSQGLWSGDRLPKLVDPRQAKTNWDYVMDEMQWLATDFAQERKWKIAAARKIARAVRQYHRAKEEKKKKEEREAYLKKRRLAAKIARMVHTFWDGINRVVQYKHESLMEEKRQKILDIQLNFIVGQTERYSGYLTKQLQANNEEESKSADAPPTSTAKDGDKESSEVPPISSSTQGEAAPKEDESSEKEKVAEAGEKDVEAKAEEEKESKESSNVAEEDAAQQITVRRSSRKRNAASTDSSSATNTAACEKPPKIAKTEESGTPGNDEEFDPEAEGNVSDDEATMQQEEDQQDEKEDHKEEIKELEEDNDLSIEELMRKYGYEVPSKDDSAAADENAPPEEGSSKSEEAGEQDEKDEGKKEEDEGDDEALKFLVDDDDDADADKNKEVAESGDFDEASKQARNIQPTGHTLATTQVKTPIPKLLRGELREYQHIGLNWLVTLYNERLNGILADEMGLGKTIQTIALLAHLACEKGVWGPHLIVVPTSVMLNWEMEFKKWCPGFKILTYYGNQKERKMKRTGWSKSNAFHVCITSYKLVVQDHAAFRRRKWRYLILDEAHNIKNFKSQRWQALLNFNSQRRLLLTGTPLQNNLMELWSLMHFLMPHLFQSRNDFKDWFANPLDGMVGGEAEYNEGIIRRLHKVLRPFLLRRVKKEVEKQMPNKYEHVVRCHLSKRQRFLYEDFMSRAATKDTLAKGDLLSVMNVLMQLRKVCNHPNLFEPRPIVTSFTTRALEYQPPSLVASCLVERDPLAQAINLTDLNLHLPALCGFTTHQVDSIRQLRADDRQLIELSPAQFPTESKTNKISTSMRKTIMDKLAKRSMASYHERVEKVKKSLSASIDRQFNSRSQQSSSSQQLMNVASVASLERIKGNKRLDAESYSKWLGRMQQARKAENRVRTARINERRCDVSNQAVSSNLIKLLQSIYLCKREDDYVNNRYAELASVVINKLYKEMREMQTLDKVDIVIPRVESPSMLYHQQHPPQWETYQLKNKKDFLVDYFKPCKLMMSKKLLFPETQLIQYDCGKLQILNVLLRRFQEGKHRVLIFTQMTKVLDILEVFLNYHGYRYLRLDGSTHIEERMIRMERFNNDKRIFCFILSTRSGGIGVNLTGADTVVFYDSDWNPTMDAQAQDRCHRIGQTRDVHIYRLISERTIEENILRKANQKRMLNNLAIEGGHFTTSFFTKQGIKDIFAEPSGLENMDEDQQKLEQKIQDKQNQQKQQEEASSASSSAAAEAADTKKDEKEFGEALLRSEDMEDQCAAEMVEKEQIAEREEFGDNPNINNSNQAEGVTRAEEKIRAVYEQLSSLQRYAVDYIERNANISFDDQLQMAQEDLEKAKKTWEVNHLLSLKEEEERRLEEEEDDIFYVCEEGVNQVRNNARGGGKKRKKKERDICFMDMSTSEDSAAVADEDDEPLDRLRQQQQQVKVRRRRRRKAQVEDVTPQQDGDDDDGGEELAKSAAPKKRGPKKKRDDGQPGVRRRVRRSAKQQAQQAAHPKLDSNDEFEDDIDDEISSYYKRNDPLWSEFGDLIKQQQSGRYFDVDDENSDDDEGDYDVTMTERMLEQARQRQVDFGPNEITSFSRRGRARKKNKWLSDDYFDFPFQPTQSRPTLNIVVEHDDPLPPRPTATKNKKKQSKEDRADSPRNLFSSFQFDDEPEFPSSSSSNMIVPSTIVSIIPSSTLEYQRSDDEDSLSSPPSASLPHFNLKDLSPTKPPPATTTIVQQVKTAPPPPLTPPPPKPVVVQKQLPPQPKIAPKPPSAAPPPPQPKIVVPISQSSKPINIVKLAPKPTNPNSPQTNPKTPIQLLKRPIAARNFSQIRIISTQSSNRSSAQHRIITTSSGGPAKILTISNTVKNNSNVLVARSSPLTTPVICRPTQPPARTSIVIETVNPAATEPPPPPSIISTDEFITLDLQPVFNNENFATPESSVTPLPRHDEFENDDERDFFHSFASLLES